MRALKGKEVDINSNAFDIVGLVATCSILFAHTVGHSGLVIKGILYDIITNFFRPGEALAAIFSISGFLVAASWERTKHLGRFFLKRIIKIYPALILVVVLPSIVYLVLGYVESDLVEYVKYLIRRIVFQTGEDMVPAGAKGNVSLWTIIMQMQFYFLTPVCVKYLKKRGLVVGGLVVIFFTIYNMVTPTLEISNKYLELLYYSLCFPYFYMYLLGVVCYLNREKILPWLISRAYLLLGIYAFLQCIVRVDDLYTWNYINPFSGWIICLAVIGLSYRIGNKHLSVDPSYGIYLWHMPIMEAIHYILKIEYSFPMIIIVWMASIGVGIIQYNLIEKTFQRLLLGRRKQE